MSKIKIRSTKDSSELKRKLLDICSKSDIRIMKVFLNTDGCSVVCASEADADKLFMEPTIGVLASNDIHPVLPIALKAKRSVIVRNVDSIIYDNEVNTIINELHSRNPWASVQEIIKFPNSKTLKITFRTAEMSSKCLTNGLLFFQLFVPGNCIRGEVFIEITTCYRCYKVNDHISANCSFDATYKICSVCSSTDHRWKNCQSTVKKCINCGGGHNALSSVCPRRKELLQKKRAEVNRPNSFSSAAAGGQVLHNAHNFSKDASRDIVKSYSCIMLAILKSADNPSSFNAVVNNLFTQNNLPSLSLNDFSPPKLSSLIGTDERYPPADDAAKHCSVNVGQSSRGALTFQGTHIPAERIEVDSIEDSDGYLPGKSLVAKDTVTASMKFPDNYKALIKNGSGNINRAQFMHALKSGNAVVIDDTDAVIDYNNALEICKVDDFLERITEVKMNIIDKYKKSPRRQLRYRSK